MKLDYLRHSKQMGNAALAFLASLALAFASGLVMAQEEEESELVEEASEMEEETLIVTGSRIAHSPTDGPQPLIVITRTDIEDSGLLSIGDLIQRLPIQGSGINRTYNNGGDGSIRVELRALGAARTLVLVNGERWVSSGEGANSSIDLNTVPIAAIERVEVLKDGASAVYGSDAIAGVVNIILRKSYDGMEFMYQTGGFTEEGGGQEGTYSLIGGGSTDRFNFTLGAAWTNIDALSNADRAQTAARPVGGGSAGTPQGRFAYGGVVGGWSNWTLNEGQAGTDPSHFREWTNDDRFNYNPDNYIQTPNERRNLFLNGSYELLDGITFNFDALYQNRLSDQLLAPTPLFWGFSSDEGIDATNIYNPFGITFCGLSGTNNLGQSCAELDEPVRYGWFGRRMVEAGDRNFLQDIESFRTGLGISGSWEGWDWQAGYAWAQNKASVEDHGLLNTDAVRQALGPAANCVAPCVPLNIFGGQGTDAQYIGDGLWSGSGSITQAMLDWITFTAHHTGGNTMKNITAHATGTLWDAPAGPVGVAFGFESRSESGYTSPDALIVSGVTSGNASKPTKGSFDVDEMFAEVSVPIMSDSQFAESLDFGVAFRTSNYSTFGRNSTGKYNIMWRPISDLLVRMTSSGGFRAPSISELFFGQSDSYPELQDPCDVDSANFTGNAATGQQTNAQCIADGVPNGFTQPNTQIRITVGGNPDLQPEESSHLSWGLVYQPSRMEGFQAELDFFSVEITDTIDSIGAANILEECYSERAQYCEFVDRGPGGFVVDLRDLAANVGTLDVSGLDLALSWVGISTDYGTFDLDWDMTILDTYDTTDAIGTRFMNAGYVFGSSRNNIAEFRSSGHATWVGSNWSVRLSRQFIGEAKGIANTSPNYEADGTFNPGDEPRTLDATPYYDVIGTYNWTRDDMKIIASFGIDNLLATDPPYFPESFANDYDPDYRAWGSRFWYGRVKFLFD